MDLLQLFECFVPELSQGAALLSLYGSLALALLTCFFGYRLRQVWYALLVFAISALLGFGVSRWFFPDRLWLCLLIGLGCGLVIRMFTYRIYQVVVFLVAFGCVSGTASSFLTQYLPAAAWLSVVLGILAGLLAAKYQYRGTILVTAISGGWQAGLLLGRCIPSLRPESTLLLAFGLMLGGSIFQFIANKGKK